MSPDDGFLAHARRGGVNISGCGGLTGIAAVAHTMTGYGAIPYRCIERRLAGNFQPAQLLRALPGSFDS